MKQRSGVIGHKESGVGIVEVMVAAAILSTAVGGTIYLTSSASQLGTSSNNVAQGAELGASVVEIAQFKPDASYISSQISSIQTTSSSNSFTLNGVAVSSAGSTDSVSVTVSWTNPFIDNANKTQRFTLGSSVTPTQASKQFRKLPERVHQGVRRVRHLPSQPLQERERRLRPHQHKLPAGGQRRLLSVWSQVTTRLL